MSLLGTEKTAGASTAAPAFESDETTNLSGAAAAATATTAVATQQGGALGAVRTMENPLGALKNALTVDYNTLEQVIATNGNFMLRENDKVLGDQVDFEVLSFQDSWVVSPEDQKAPIEVVKFSNDGLVCTDGTAVAEHLIFLRTNGYPRAKLKQRAVVVGALMKTSKPVDMEGTLVQFDLSPASRTQWDRFTANTAFQVKMGKFKSDQVTKVRATAEITKGPDNSTYTLAKFAVAV